MPLRELASCSLASEFRARVAAWQPVGFVRLTAENAVNHLVAVWSLVAAAKDSSLSARQAIGSRARSRRRAALRHGRGDGYETIDGIVHKQSDKADDLPRGFPGAKFARKAALGKIGIRG